MLSQGDFKHSNPLELYRVRVKRVRQLGLASALVPRVNAWECMGVDGNGCQSLRVDESGWKCLEIAGNV